MAEIFVTTYLGLGFIATMLIWLALMASKQSKNQAGNSSKKHFGYNHFRDRNTQPSRLHS